MSVPDIKPVKGMLVLRLIDDGDEDDDTQPLSSGDGDEQTCIGQVIATGADTGVKKGQVVLARAWARNATRLDDNTVIVDSYCILGTIAVS